MAADRIAPRGLAMFFPASGGADPCTGSNMPVLPGCRFAGGACELERMADDAVDALVRVELLLNRHFVDGIRLEAAADAYIQPFGIFAKHHEVDVGRGAALQRAQAIVEQANRALIDVEIERETGAEQDVARVAVV